VLLAASAWGQQYTISTIVGDQSLGAGYTGDGGPATAAQLSAPMGLTMDSKGNLFIGDTVNHVVRQVSGGTISTIAGNNTGGYYGDAGTTTPQVPTSAQFRNPSALVVTSGGDLLISDTLNQVVRKVSGNTVSVFAGTGATLGLGCDNCAANTTYLFKPIGLALDSAGNLYIADSGNNVVRKVNTSNIVTTLFEPWRTAPPFVNPVAVAVSPNGQIVYIADIGNNVIWAFNQTNLTMKVFAGTGATGYSGDGGPATQAMLNYAAGLATDAAGNVYIADTENSLIRVVTPDGIINTIAGRVINGKPSPGYAGDGGIATSAQLAFPKGLYIASGGVIYVSDGGNNVVRMLQPTVPTLSSGGVGNGFSYKQQISPGAAAVLYGTGLAGPRVTGPVPLQNNLAGIQVLVNGEIAPLYYVSPGQINFQVPWDIKTGTASISVKVNAVTSNTVTVPVVSAGPGLYSVVQNYATPVYTTNGPSNPVAAGGTIIAYATGSGPVNSPQTNGVPVPISSQVVVTSTCTATIGTTTVTPTFCGLAPLGVGLMQVNINVPTGLAAGTYPLTLTIGGQSSNAVNISVK
jgi:uncharacterized protein (TIGR03437 family)